MRIHISLLCLCISFLSLNAQNAKVLNNYKAIYLPQLYYNKGKADIYEIRKTVADKLYSCGVPVFADEKDIPNEVIKNPCSILQCIVNNSSSSKGSNFSDIKILFLDCKNDTLLYCFASANVRVAFNDTKMNFIKAAQEAMEPFNNYHYQFINSDSLASSNEPVSDHTDSISWNANKKLSWSDFKGTADSHDPADALTYTSHQTRFQAFGMGTRFNVESEVLCYFIKNKSWVKPGMQSDYLLNHEQRHFDLAEAGAREFRKMLKLAHFTAENFQKEVRKITEEIDEKYKKLQNQYDRETDHSRVEEKQKEWNAKINSMLKALEEYK